MIWGSPTTWETFIHAAVSLNFLVIRIFLNQGISSEDETLGRFCFEQTGDVLPPTMWKRPNMGTLTNNDINADILATDSEDDRCSEQG